ncbi:helix-turn-helix transcriptional regulator [Saccharopolyspora sp. 5N708]|uniref:helix-turn-helix transcriptional regulator n=1 Tax=Saccharopolyspora sp. 5N708 TaxID=3457424 RepID=UPI003FD5EC02
MDKRELAAFLRVRRESLRPPDLGLPAGPRRRTPGLRREEIAQLAHISTDYYTRLEQARGRHPSTAVLAGLARALRLSTPERDYLFELVGAAPDPPARPSSEVRASLLTLLERMPDSAVLVLDAKYDVIAWNSLAAALLEDFSAVPQRDRNLIRRYFLPDPAQRRYGLADDSDFGEYAVAHLRSATARYPADPGIRALVAELRAASPEFAHRWQSHQVRTAHHLPKTIDHPVVGHLVLHCDVLLEPQQDQHVVIYTAEPGSPSDQAMQLLKVIGTQRITIPT